MKIKKSDVICYILSILLFGWILISFIQVNINNTLGGGVNPTWNFFEVICRFGTPQATTENVVETTTIITTTTTTETTTTTTTATTKTQETELSQSDFELLSNVVMAEAGNQEFTAQYYVACTILNRLKSKLFPNTLKEIIYARNPIQFSVMYDGAYNRIVRNGGASDQCKRAVQKALVHNETPEDMYYFTSCGYLRGTVPYKKIHDMYFSTQKTG